jgi:hypothetical protein
VRTGRAGGHRDLDLIGLVTAAGGGLTAAGLEAVVRVRAAEALARRGDRIVAAAEIARAVMLADSLPARNQRAAALPAVGRAAARNGDRAVAAR